MICPFCRKHTESAVLKTVDLERAAVDRLRLCQTCKRSFPTVETVDQGWIISTGGQGWTGVDRGGHRQPDGGFGGSASLGSRSDSGSTGSVLVPDPLFVSGSQGVDPARAKQAKRAAEPPAFAAFWAIYPRKVARAAALKAWIKIDPTSDLIQLIQSAIVAQRAGFLAREADKIPHAATWLNGQRWNDSIEGAPRVANGRLNAVDRKTEEIRQSFEQGRAWAANLAKGGT